jgi:hypothetical protein
MLERHANWQTPNAFAVLAQPEIGVGPEPQLKREQDRTGPIHVDPVTELIDAKVSPIPFRGSFKATSPLKIEISEP